MENNTVSPAMPGKLARSMYFARGGRIAFNITIFCGVISFLSAIAPAIGVIISFFAWFIAALIALATLFIILAFIPNYFDSLTGTTETLEAIGFALGMLWHVTAPISLACGVLAIGCFLLDREYKHTPKIVVSAVFVVMQILIIILCTLFPWETTL